MIDTNLRDSLKPRLRDYLLAMGIEIHPGDADRIHCIAGTHPDNNPSMVVYEERLWCPSCAETMDVFAAAAILTGLSTGRDFPALVQHVAEKVGAFVPGPHPGLTAIGKRRSSVKAKEPAKVVPLNLEDAKRIFDGATVKRMGRYGLHMSTEPSEVESRWGYRNAEGLIDVLEARFPASDFSDGRKRYLSLYWDGEKVRSTNPPIVLLNRDKLAADASAPVVWHEGPKCARAAEAIPGFIHTCFNSGGKKYRQVDWSPLAGRTVYLWPDDDEPGIETAHEISALLVAQGCTVAICAPLVAARGIKPEHADIVEALQVQSPEELAVYIREGEKIHAQAAQVDSQDPRHQPGSKDRSGPGPGRRGGTSKTRGDDDPRLGGTDVPGVGFGGGDQAPPGDNDEVVDQPNSYFDILGMAEDGYAYFTISNKMMVRARPAAFNRGFLLSLAPYSFWFKKNQTSRGGVHWDLCASWLIQIVQNPESPLFDTTSARGRGAWREQNGDICYHDGLTTYGQPDTGKIYLRRGTHDIGLEDQPAAAEIRRAVLDASGLISWRSTADCVRALSWAALAPFGGALPWRPALYLTGEAGSGKTSVIEAILNPLIDISEATSGGESSAAGIRQSIGPDSVPVIIEEADGDTKKKQERIEDILSLMRQSTSANAPKVVKGTTEGHAVTYPLRSMFCFAAINPEVKSIPDQSRLSFCHVVKSSGKSWTEIYRKLTEAINPSACRGIRSFTWSHLPRILELAEDFRGQILDANLPSMDSRRSYIDGLLFAAYWMVWRDQVPKAEEFGAWIQTVYAASPADETRSEADELVQRILDESVVVQGSRDREQRTIKSLLFALKSGDIEVPDDTHPSGVARRKLSAAERQRFKATVALSGVTVNREGDLCVAVNHHQVRRITGLENGYSKVLARHRYVRDGGKARPVNFGESDCVRRSVVISDVIYIDGNPLEDP